MSVRQELTQFSKYHGQWNLIINNLQINIKIEQYGSTPSRILWTNESAALWNLISDDPFSGAKTSPFICLLCPKKEWNVAHHLLFIPPLCPLSSLFADPSHKGHAPHSQLSLNHTVSRLSLSSIRPLSRPSLPCPQSCLTSCIHSTISPPAYIGYSSPLTGHYSRHLISLSSL